MSDEMDDNTLLQALNSLLISLELPLTLETPLDLTPFLILAIFESMLRSRLSISAEVRRSLTRPAKIEAMKIFLGVLGDDILSEDVGLDDVDPRRLADGERDEVIYVGKLLCWLGKKLNYISEDGQVVGDATQASADHDHQSLSSSTRSTATNSQNTNLSMHSVVTGSDTTMTSIASTSFEEHTPSTSPSVRPLARQRPRCIHEVAELPAPRAKPSRTSTPPGDTSFCDCPPELTSISMSTPPVRRTGWIKPVNSEREIHSFETWKEQSAILQSLTTSRSNALPPAEKTPPPRGTRPVTRHTSPSEHTLALLNERARLLVELAKFNGG